MERASSLFIKPNIIYWSNNPENSHGYWRANDLSPISIEDQLKN